MPITYTVTESRDRSPTFDGTGDQIKITYSKDYFVDVEGAASAEEVNEFDLIRATGLPVVNRTVWVTSVGNKIIPWVICRSKTAKPHKQNAMRWTVSTKWDTGPRNNDSESDNAPQDPPDNITDISPRVEQKLGEIQMVLFEDKSTPVKTVQTPTGNDWSQSLVERIPTLELTISQYESSLTYEAALARKFKANKGTYRNQPEYQWFIEDVRPTEVEVVLSSGPTTAVLVEYDVNYTPRDEGWRDSRALIDTHYIDGGDKKAFADDEHRTLTVGFVDSSGAWKGAAATSPDYVDYEPQDTINFSSFLQV